MTRTPLRKYSAFTLAAAATAVLFACADGARAQSGGNFLDDLFSRGETRPQQTVPRGQAAQADDPGELSVRIDRLENALRQLTGTLEQLQYRNQQLEQQLKRMQEDTEYRFQQLGSRGGAPAQAPRATQPSAPTPPAPVNPGRRGDVFDPSQNPGAPGAPRTLGGTPMIAADEPETPIGAPGGRAAGAPLDLSTLAANAAAQSPGPMASAEPVTPPQSAPRPAAPANPQIATLPPSASPQDEYDLAYGYVLHKDYALAEQAFRDFLRKYPTQRLVPDAQYWLGESLFQRQRYRDAAESFLAVSTKYEQSGKAPDSLLRLGQSLAALNQKEAACATLAEIGRKYPKASAGVKRGVAQEQKRAHC